MPGIGLSLSHQTRLAASPHLQQAVQLLQLSTIEFAQELERALGSNPFLEEVENSAVEEDATTGIDAASPVGVEPESGFIEIVEAPVGDAPTYELFEQIATREEFPGPYDAADRSKTSAMNWTGSTGADACDLVSAETSLRSHLLQQICGWGVDERLQALAAIVVDSLDEDGYLRGDMRETMLAAGAGAGLRDREIEHAIGFVQRCDPPGVAARDLSECLGLQLAAIDDDEPSKGLAIVIVGDHLSLLAHHRYAVLREALCCEEEELKAACSLIRRLDPRPGHRFLDLRSEYVVPDVIVREHQGTMIVVVNPAARPTARLNQCYAQWLRSAGPQDHPALSQQLQEARWLMQNVEQRFTTIQRVAEAIVKRQREFFAGGDIAIKPLVLREVAEDLGIHESTVSRATSNKYMQTPRGLFEFRHFFSRSLATKTGAACSATSVRALLSEMIAAEPAQTPLSDVALTRMLGQNGVLVSRRTVTKYRNLMKLAPVELRKRA